MNEIKVMAGTTTNIKNFTASAFPSHERNISNQFNGG